MLLRDVSLLPEVDLVDSNKRILGGKEVFQVINPATAASIADVADLGASSVDHAIIKAKEAEKTLRAMTPRTKATVLMKWFELVKQAAEDIAKIITSENGKPYAEALGEVDYAADFLWWFAGEAQRLNGTVTQPSNPNNRVVTIKQPVGIVGLITPWNFPAAMVTRKVGAAIAAGCPCILKPAAETPLTAICFAELGRRAGIPAGAFSVITTLKHTIEVGKILTTDPAIKKFSFTGSTAVGKLLASQCTSTMKRTSMELGGNAPFIVFNDADLEKAADGIMQSKFRLSGQTCVCANRVYIQSGIHDALVENLVSRINKFVLGPGDDPKTTLGPLISAKAADKVLLHVEDALAQGAQAVLGGKKPQGLSEAFFEPTLLVNVSPHSLCAREETFGPLLSIIKFETEEEVISYANAVSVGLAGYLFTNNLARAWQVAEALEVGMAGVNTGLISDASSPFGGIKESGQGREGSFMGADEYLESKSITLNIGS